MKRARPEMHGSLKVARLILTEVNRVGVRTSDGYTGVVYAYANGREQGYTIGAHRSTHSGPGIDLRVGVTFAENRNSDDIVVYVDPDWNMYNDGLSDSAHETRKLFEAYDYVKAARYIVRALEKVTMKYFDIRGR